MYLLKDMAMIMKIIRIITMLCCHTKQTIIKAIKMIAIKFKIKGKKERPIKVDQIDKIVDRWFFVYLNWAFPNRYIYIYTLF